MKTREVSIAIFSILQLARATTVTVDTPLTDLAEFTKERKTIRLDCLCDGGRCDINKVKWFKDGREVRLDYATYLVVDDRLEMFTRNREQIVGEYYCKSQNDKSDIAIVKDSSKERISITGRNHRTVSSGDSWKAQCSSNALPKLRIEWFKDGFLVNQADAEVRPEFEEGTSTIYVESITDDDGGEFSCCGVDQYKPVPASEKDCKIVSKPVKLVVEQSRWLVRPPKMVTEKPGNDVHIPCQPNTVEPDFIVWSKIDNSNEPVFRVKSDEQLDDRIFVAPNGTLTIKAVQASDMADYVCSYNKYEVRTIFTVLSPNTNMATVLDVYVNETVVMSCETSGETASWFHNSKPISFASSSDVRLGPTAKLLIPSANETHAGEWQCKNSSGSVFYNLKVNTVTGIVPNIPNVTQQSGNILIAWDNNTKMPDAQQHTIIQFKSGDDDIWRDLGKTYGKSHYNSSSKELLEICPDLKMVSFRVAHEHKRSGKAVRTPFSPASTELELYSINQLVMIVGGLCAGLLLLFILAMLLAMRKCTDMKGSSRTKEFTYNKSYPTYGQNTQPLFLIRNGSDSGHGTHSSTSRHEIDNFATAWVSESPRLYGKRYEDTVNSRQSSSHHSVYNYNQSAVAASFQRNGIGEYAQIDMLPVDSRNKPKYDLRQEPIYESIDHTSRK